MKFFVFGDSIAHGSWDELGGWAERLKQYINKKYPQKHFVYNLGIVYGITTKGLLKQIDPEIKTRNVDPDKVGAIIIEIGTNDSIINNKTKKLWTSEKQFEKNLHKIVKIAKKYSKNIFLLGLFPINLDPIPWDNENSYKKENTKKFDQLVKKVCEKDKVHFIDIYEKLEEKHFENLLVDGCHPGSKGHELIFQIVKDFLEKNRII